ncbi:MAG: hypothetical protein NTZ56_02835 [Acidobacteria bacterium]|nr:hypothetical protein [Acidobacteriota bacterium]
MAHLLQGLVLLVLGAAALCAQPAAAPPASPAKATIGKKVAVKFSHATHLKLGDLGPILKMARERGTHLRPEGHLPGSQCEACHTGMKDDQRRAGLPLMGDCLVCHSKIDAPFSCGFCHSQPASELKPVHHTPDFLDKHSAGLAKLNLAKQECQVCHGRKFTCLGCH